jgi:hypothetical protein
MARTYSDHTQCSLGPRPRAPTVLTGGDAPKGRTDRLVSLPTPGAPYARLGGRAFGAEEAGRGGGLGVALKHASAPKTP